MTSPLCTIIIPSYNRRTTLEQVLRGLQAQTAPREQWEVVVVLDGSTDDSATMLTEWESAGRLPLRWHRQANAGQAAARNTGANIAHAPLLLFLDDDIVPEPGCVAAHLAAHERAPNESLVVLGDCRIVRALARPAGSLRPGRFVSYCQLGMWAWWEDVYSDRAAPGRVPMYRDFCAGNASLRREDFLRVGGFDTQFRGYGGEDYELGYRLLQAGARFIADRNAQAQHYHRATVPGILRMSRQSARGDVVIARKYPELRAGLALAHLPPGRYRLLVHLALQAPALGDFLMALIQLALPLFERLQMRRRWLEYFGHVRGYSYWRGVRDVLGSWEALMQFQAEAPRPPVTVFDITHGLPADLATVWVHGPAVVEIIYAGQRVGWIDWPEAITAPLRPYLAGLIAKHLWRPVLVSLASNPNGLKDL